MELTEEQKQKIKKLKKQFMLTSLGVGILYSLFLFFANLSIVVINLSYVNNPQFASVASIGTAFLTLVGLRGTLQEVYDIFKQEVEKVLNNR